VKVALWAHPATPGAAVRNIAVELRRKTDALLINYVIEGELERLRIPAPRTPRAADRLWQHTCCEMFVARAGAAAYHEFNFSPSGEWAAYAFTAYRRAGSALKVAPTISVRRSRQKLELDAAVQCEVRGKLSVGLSAVIEGEDGALSYWALKHPAGKPDFHHSESFALELDEVRD
jgi:hypothetical protein